MSRMFKSINQTWNIFVGCRFDCTYCNARKSALTRFKHIDRYKDGFWPHFVESEILKKFKPGEFIFIGYMGDISFASRQIVAEIFNRVHQFPRTRFLLCTKDPSCFTRWGLYIPENIVLATTIESNREYGLSKAPSPYVRYLHLRDFDHPHKMVSIEPVMEMDIHVVMSWLRDLRPEIIEIGADNYGNKLNEPWPERIKRLLYELHSNFPCVIEKDGLERLNGVTDNTT